MMQDVTMKNIPPSSLPTFYGKSNEDPDTFMFEFDILCRIYNYLQDAHKLKLFPATLKDSALRWFMGLGEFTISTWDDMKLHSCENIKSISNPRTLDMIYSRYNNLNMRSWRIISKCSFIHYINLNIVTSEKM